MEEQIKLEQAPTHPTSVYIRLMARKYDHLYLPELRNDFMGMADKVNELEQSIVNLIFQSLWRQVNSEFSNIRIKTDMSLSVKIMKDEKYLLEPIVKKVAREFGKFQNIGEVFLVATYEDERAFEYVFGFNFMKNP